ALRTDRAAVSLDDLFDNGESDAGPAAFARAGLLPPVKPLEDTGQIFFPDSFAVVGQGDLDLTVRRQIQVESGFPAVRGVLEDILEQVLNDPDNLIGIGCYRGGRQIDLEMDLFFIKMPLLLFKKIFESRNQGRSAPF